MKKILLMIFMLILVTGCSTLKVDVDYDTAYDFSKKTKYAVIHSERVGDNSLVEDRIRAAIRESLDAKTYSEVPKGEADLLFVFHVDVRDKEDVNMDYQMVGFGSYGFGRGFGMGYGGMIASPSTYKYREGTLVIDALNPKTNKVVWRGIALDELSKKSTTPDEKTKYINKVVASIMAKFPPNGNKK